MNRFALLLITGVLATALHAQTITSVVNGDAQTATTWDCNCVPTFTADLVIKNTVTLSVYRSYHNVTISNGGVFIKQGSGGLDINGNLDIKLGGTMTNNMAMQVKGNYSIAGNHDGNKNITLSGNNKTINGTAAGKILNQGTLIISGGNKTIPAGQVVTKNNGQVRLDGVTVTNNGTFIGADFLANGASSAWIQGTMGTLTVRGNFGVPLDLQANATGNIVEFIQNGSNQNIKKTTDLHYYDLRLSSNGVSHKKILKGDIIVLHDLAFTSCTFDTRDGLVDHNITVGGNWTNTNAVFVPRNTLVTFNNPVVATLTSGSTEPFNDVAFTGSDTLKLATSIQAGHDVTIAGKLDAGVANNTITVGHDWTNTGTFIRRQGNVVFNGSGTQYQMGRTSYHDLTIDKSSGRVEVNGGRQKVYHTLWLLNGEYRTNDSLSMSSDASGDSRIAPINGATITGKVYVQRYVDAGATNWRFLTAPTQGLALNDWQDNFVMSGFPGSHWPTFPFTSVYSYDESAPGTEDDGFVPASDISQTVAMGQGLWVWCGDSLNGTDPFEIDGRGPVYTGDLDLPVTYTSHGTPSGDGWNMAANPYVSAIDWNSANWTKSHINNAVYIWNPDAQNFAGYVGGVSVNGGSRYIASSQAFWVQANAASPLLRITENCKTAQAAAFRSEEQGPEDILRLRVIGNGAADETVLRAAPETTTGFDADYDAYKKWSATATAPNICTKMPGGMNVMVNSFPPFTTDTIIPVKVKVGAQGSYSIEFTEVGGSFAQRCMMLEDVVLGTMTPIVVGGSYTFTMGPGYNGTRFRFRASGQLTVDVTGTTCSYTFDGRAIAHPSGTGPWTYNWTDALGSPVQSHTDIVPDTLFNAHGGIYSLTVDGQGGCAQLSADVEIPSPPPTDVQATVINGTCDGASNGSIDLSVSGGTMPYAYSWSTGATTEDLHTLAPGNYFVDIADSNQCTVTMPYVIAQDPAPAASFTSPAQAFTGESVAFDNTSTNASQATWDFGDGSPTSIDTSPSHIYQQPGSYTITLTAGDTLCQDVAIGGVLIDPLSTSITTINTANGYHLEQSDDRLYLVVEGDVLRDLELSAHNVLGQELMATQRGTYATGRTAITIDKGAFGTLLVTVVDRVSGQRTTLKVVR